MSEKQEGNHKKLVIAFDAKRLFNNFTGLGNYSRNLVRNLQKYYPECDYHLFTPKITDHKETAFFIDSPAFSIHTPAGFEPFWRTRGMSSQINELKPHIFHGLSHEIPFGIHSDTITAVTFHDLIFEKFPAQFGWWDKMVYRFKYRSAAKRADYIVAISDSTKHDLEEMYQIKADKITTIYQSCHELYQDFLSTDGNFPPELMGISGYYLYVGSLIERKGLIQIIIAYAGLAEAYRKPLVVIGKGNKQYIYKVNDLIKYYKLEDYVFFFDTISNQDLVAVYDECFALLYPSIYEGFGIPVIESLFRKKPVITSDISSLPEAAGPGAILVNPYSPEDIRKAMIMLHNEEYYQKLSHEGLEYVTNKFSSETTAQDLMSHYLKWHDVRGDSKPEKIQDE